MPASADLGPVIHRALVLTAFVCCGLVAASFALFARDQLAGASAHQQSQLAANAPISPGVTPIHHSGAQPRRFIDGAAKVLTTPFRAIIQSDSAWVVHGVPTFLALLVYGVGLGFLARFSSGFARP
ncbi:MAG TPA: hypothetical protein VMU39_04375 [Solirubrobacteraceae bacterium]|nr:hypothetical protein [Solirubrobacteraceae bacterium]